MSKIIRVSVCDECPHRITAYCQIDDECREIELNVLIPEWCPLPDEIGVHREVIELEAKLDLSAAREQINALQSEYDRFLERMHSYRLSELNALSRERDALHAILCKCAKAVGGSASEESTIEFLSGLPDEILAMRMTEKKLRANIGEPHEALSKIMNVTELAFISTEQLIGRMQLIQGIANDGLSLVRDGGSDKR